MSEGGFLIRQNIFTIGEMMDFLFNSTTLLIINIIITRDRSPGVAKKDNSVSSSLEKMIVYVSQRKKNLENVSHGLNQIPENHM